MSDCYAVIMAGGKGERFWPLSTSARPKQLLDLVGDRPLLGQAVERLKGLVPPERIFVVTNRELEEGCRDAAPELPPENVVGEPVGRDTAAAVALGTALVAARDPNAVFCVLTADHVIHDAEGFQRVLSAALERAGAEPALLTIGIHPTAPSTAYGYIEVSGTSENKADSPCYTVKRFVEKPDLETANGYLQQGGFYWNSGMFIWSVPTIMAAFRANCPYLADLSERLSTCAVKELSAMLDVEYPALKKISIDYAIMEKADNILMTPAAFDWDDVGSWNALEHHFEPSDQGNVVVGTCESVQASNNIVYSRDRLTALVGVNNLIVVQADGVTLICPKGSAQNVKQLVQQLREQGTYGECL